MAFIPRKSFPNHLGYCGRGHPNLGETYHSVARPPKPTKDEAWLRREVQRAEELDAAADKKAADEAWLRREVQRAEELDAAADREAADGNGNGNGNGWDKFWGGLQEGLQAGVGVLPGLLPGGRRPGANMTLGTYAKPDNTKMYMAAGAAGLVVLFLVFRKK